MLNDRTGLLLPCWGKSKVRPFCIFKIDTRNRASFTVQLIVYSKSVHCHDITTWLLTSLRVSLLKQTSYFWPLWEKVVTILFRFIFTCVFLWFQSKHSFGTWALCSSLMCSSFLYFHWVPELGFCWLPRLCSNGLWESESKYWSVLASFVYASMLRLLW